MSTIAAISSPIGAGGIGIVRVSGNEALRIADAIFIFAHNKASADASFVMPEAVKEQWTPLFMNYGTFDAGEFCDKGYAVYFPAKRAYTGEDTVEFYLHGGVRIMQGALDALLRNGAVMAKNGEFTKRAFLNGKMDLSQAEAVMDVIDAENKTAVRLANQGINGKIYDMVKNYRQQILDIIAIIDVNIDYPEYDDVEILTNEKIEPQIDVLLNDLKKLLKDSIGAKYLKEGINTAIIGKPNVGKSTILNAILKENKAIVTNIPGTTRDVIEGKV